MKIFRIRASRVTVRHISSCWSNAFYFDGPCEPTVAGILWYCRFSKFERPENSHLIFWFDPCSFSAWWGEWIQSTFYLCLIKSLEDDFCGTPIVSHVQSKQWRNVCNIGCFKYWEQWWVNWCPYYPKTWVRAPDTLSDFWMNGRVKWRWRKSY